MNVGCTSAIEANFIAFGLCPMSVGCTSAIEANFIAFGLHDI